MMSNNAFFLNLGDGLHELFHNPQANRMDILTELFVTANGRLNRKSLIYRSLFLSCFFFVLTLIFKILAFAIIGFPSFIFVTLLGFVNTVCCLTMAIRRFHDVGRCGLWVLLLFVPVLNFFVSLYLIFVPGDQGPNDYGPDPLEGTRL